MYAEALKMFVLLTHSFVFKANKFCATLYLQIKGKCQIQKTHQDTSAFSSILWNCYVLFEVDLSLLYSVVYFIALYSSSMYKSKMCSFLTNYFCVYPYI